MTEGLILVLVRIEQRIVREYAAVRMAVQRGIIAVDVIVLAEIGHKVVGDKIEQLAAVYDKVLIAQSLIRVGDIIAVIQADEDNRCSLAVLHTFSKLGTIAEAPYTVGQEENGIGFLLVVVRRERYMDGK